MKQPLIFSAFILLSIMVYPQNLSSSSINTTYFSGGTQVGYNNGFSFQLNGTASNFSPDFPFSVRAGIEYTLTDPGSPEGARKIFINDATNGTPEESGKVLELRLDFLKRIDIFSLKNAFVFAGPRFSFFTGTFSFIGGNEVFDISSTQFGLGAGIENYFKLSNHLDLVFSTGADYFFQSEIYGHDTSYSPDGENVNPREDFSYADADDAIDQPKLQLRILAGVVYYF